MPGGLPGSGGREAYGPVYGSGGGGFFSSLLGGLFGAAAGNWMYNSFSVAAIAVRRAGRTSSPQGGLASPDPDPRCRSGRRRRFR